MSTRFALVTALLAPALDGFKELRVQIPHATVIPGCQCGCGTIDFIFDGLSADLPRSTATSPTSCSPDIVDDDGNVIGSLILFLRDGLLQSPRSGLVSRPLASSGDGSGGLGDRAITACR